MINVHLHFIYPMFSITCKVTSRILLCSPYLFTGMACYPDPECVFPFTYNDVAYHQCTDIDHNQPWCGLASGEKKPCICKPYV